MVRSKALTVLYPFCTGTACRIETTNAQNAETLTTHRETARRRPRGPRRAPRGIRAQNQEAELSIELLLSYKVGL